MLKKLFCALLTAAVLFSAALCEPSAYALAADTEPRGEIPPAFSSALKSADTEDFNAVTYDILLEELDRLAASYPDLIRLDAIGTSVMGRTIPMIIMGSGKSEACLAAGIHADEHITVLYLLRCIEKYAAAAASGDGMFDGYPLRELFEEYTLYIIPSCNPDGTEKVLKDAEVNYTKKSFTLEERRTYRSNANEVDLNRNYPFCWSRINNGYTSPGLGYYKGPSAGSEPETAALMALCNEHDFLFMVSFHIQGRLIYYRDTENGKVPGDYELAKAISDSTETNSRNRVLSLSPSPTSNVNSFGGGFENWFRASFNRPGIVVELADINLKLKKYETTISSFEKTVDYQNVKDIMAETMRVSLLYGDLDRDRELTQKDASLLFRWWNGRITLTNADLLLGDYNRDGKTDLRDASALFRSIG